MFELDDEILFSAFSKGIGLFEGMKSRFLSIFQIFLVLSDLQLQHKIPVASFKTSSLRLYTKQFKS